jgi:hypothetical protein
MSATLLYLLKLSISLSIIWIFYQLMLRRLTFYNLNRWYLLGYSLLSFIIPLINIGSLLEKDSFQGGQVIPYIPVIGSYKKDAVPDAALFSTVSLSNVLSGILLLGSVVLLIRLVSRWLSLRKVRQKATLISDTGVKIYQVDESIIPFSFGNAIYVNQQLHTEKEYSAIILHEYVHIRQRHTIDILLGELLCIVNWYNPFAWLIRYSIRQNLEFIADRKVLENGVDKKGYQYHLLQVIGSPRYRLANNFNFSSLKKRIIMMNRIKSARLHLVKFLFIVPLLATLLLAFRDKISNSVRAASSTASVKRSNNDSIIINGSVTIDNNLYSFNDLKLALDDSLKMALNPGAARLVAAATVTHADTVPKKANPANPLYVLNGVPMPENWAIDSISPKDIKSIDVIKNEEGIRLYGPRAVNGVVVITMKNSNLPAPAASNPPLSAADSTVKTNLLARDTLRRPHLTDPLIYIDGVEASQPHMNVLNPTDIESINVIKGDSAILKYGEKGRNGVILIHMKQQARTRTMILDTKEGERLTMEADSIIWKTKESDSREVVCFIDGKRVRGVASVESLISRQDTHAIESTEKEEFLAKYGLTAKQMMVNIITRANRNNPAAYMLAFH